MTNSTICQTYLGNELLFYQDLQTERATAFQCLYLQTYQMCLPYAKSKGANQEEAEDLLQECLAIFIEKVRNGSYAFQENAKITTYFYRIYVNQWKKMAERKLKRGEVSLPWFESAFSEDNEPSNKELTILHISGEEAYDEEERTWIFTKLQKAMNLLKEDCRQVLTWFYVEDWSLRQIGEALGLTEASATVKRFKCATYLKKKFELV
ncbi:MAG: RNA polymerase sigma factor [Spirosomataceae bacterium]